MTDNNELILREVTGTLENYKGYEKIKEEIDTIQKLKELVKNCPSEYKIRLKDFRNKSDDSLFNIKESGYFRWYGKCSVCTYIVDTPTEHNTGFFSVDYFIRIYTWDNPEKCYAEDLRIICKDCYNIAYSSKASFYTTNSGVQTVSWDVRWDSEKLLAKLLTERTLQVINKSNESTTIVNSTVQEVINKMETISNTLKEKDEELNKKDEVIKNGEKSLASLKIEVDRSKEILKEKEEEIKNEKDFLIKQQDESLRNNQEWALNRIENETRELTNTINSQEEKITEYNDILQKIKADHEKDKAMAIEEKRIQMIQDSTIPANELIVRINALEHDLKMSCLELTNQESRYQNLLRVKENSYNVDIVHKKTLIDQYQQDVSIRDEKITKLEDNITNLDKRIKERDKEYQDYLKKSVPLYLHDLKIQDLEARMHGLEGNLRLITQEKDMYDKDRHKYAQDIIYFKKNNDGLRDQLENKEKSQEEKIQKLLNEDKKQFAEINKEISYYKQQLANIGVPIWLQRVTRFLGIQSVTKVYVKTVYGFLIVTISFCLYALYRYAIFTLKIVKKLTPNNGNKDEDDE